MTAVHVAGDAPSSERPRPHPDIETAFVAPQTILYDDRSGSVYELSPSASAVWLLLDGEATVADVTLDLAEILGRSPDEVAPDIGTALADFRERGLLADDDGESAAGANDLAPSAPAGRPYPLPPPPGCGCGASAPTWAGNIVMRAGKRRLQGLVRQRDHCRQDP